MNLGELRADVYEFFGYGSAPDPEIIARVDRHLTAGHRDLLGRKHFRRLRRQLVTFASIADTPFAVIPQAAVKIWGIADRTNDHELEEKTLAYIRRLDPALRASAANPWAFAVYNAANAVARQPSDASQLFIDSTSAADTKTAYIEGITTGGYHRTASITMTGVTAVAFAPTDFIAVTKLYLSQPAVGVVTLHEDASGGTELARIPVGKQYARYGLIHLYPTPTAAVTYYADVDIHIEDFTNAGDEPIIPEEFHSMLLDYAKSKEWGKREKQKLKEDYMNDFLRRIPAMITHVNAMAGPPSDNSGPRRHSALGPYYPAGT